MLLADAPKQILVLCCPNFINWDHRTFALLCWLRLRMVVEPQVQTKGYRMDPRALQRPSGLFLFRPLLLKSFLILRKLMRAGTRIVGFLGWLALLRR
jgi:hypothetical protein